MAVWEQKREGRAPLDIHKYAVGKSRRSAYLLPSSHRSTSPTQEGKVMFVCKELDAACRCSMDGGPTTIVRNLVSHKRPM